MRLADLPPGPLRDQALAQAKDLGLRGPKGSARRRRGPSHDAAPCAGTCTCGEAFDRYTAWERHRDRNDTTHRWQVDLDLGG